LIALARTSSAPRKIQVELIGLLGQFGSKAALDAVAPYLSSRNPDLALAAFLALEKAGEAGQAVIDRELKTPSAVTYSLSGFFGGKELEKKILRKGLVPVSRMRRLAAVSRKSGVPLRQLLEGIGVPLPQPV